MINVLVTGANGQLGKCIKDVGVKNQEFNFIYKNSSDLDITNLNEVELIFKEHSIDYCINCAAYTAVDKAESESKAATKVNELGPKNLAQVCAKNSSVLIHVSTDFVFDGTKPIAYNEADNVNPKSVYGLTKLNGELEVKKYLTEHYIIRTSWLYSEHGNNFMKTMIKLSNNRKDISVVSDQIGTPTYAKDLASAIVQIMKINGNFGTYHYSNEGVASWYDFANAIFDETKSKIELKPIPTIAYPTPAKRPCFSVLDKTKIKQNFDIEIPHWRTSLKRAITNLNSISN